MMMWPHIILQSIPHSLRSDRGGIDSGRATHSLPSSSLFYRALAILVIKPRSAGRPAGLPDQMKNYYNYGTHDQSRARPITFKRGREKREGRKEAAGRQSKREKPVSPSSFFSPYVCKNRREEGGKEGRLSSLQSCLRSISLFYDLLSSSSSRSRPRL